MANQTPDATPSNEGIKILKSFLKNQQTRTSLLHELEDAFSHHLKIVSDHTDISTQGETIIHEHPSQNGTNGSAHSCSDEASTIDTSLSSIVVSTSQLQQVLEITTVGLLEVKVSQTELISLLINLEAGNITSSEKLDLTKRLERVEEMEGEKLEAVRECHYSCPLFTDRTPLDNQSRSASKNIKFGSWFSGKFSDCGGGEGSQVGVPLFTTELPNLNVRCGFHRIIALESLINDELEEIRSTIIDMSAEE
jgi:hypothetical protein